MPAKRRLNKAEEGMEIKSFMLLNIIIVAVIVVCLAIIVYVVTRKIPRLKTLDVGTVPAAQADVARNRLLLARWQRGARVGTDAFKKQAEPFFVSLKKAYSGITRKIFELEKKYKREASRRVVLTGRELEKRVSDLLGEASQALQNQNLSGAEKKYLEVIGLAPKNIAAYDGIARICLDNREYKQSLQARQFAVKLLLKSKKDASDSIVLAGAYHDIGVCYRELNNPEKALESFQSALAIEPNNPRHLDKIIETSILLKNKSLAGEMLKRLASVNPDNQKIKEYSAEIEKLVIES
ncbi:MAG: tetratricopeptide repeat protein [Parcubacteria group bacterium]